ncbi:MAG TPA: SDR family oxidoreductase [Anaerolineaceae bacterium]|jgi:NAD(P)-dependent dehydrogenase (short-subunit alcohol dehydrogenase family)|nr:SDR family oxidoreductase [Anaerolineaceae bacterium]HQH84261.1 SDR family oxidoreductase [Anaerolineaceae bacterium]
MSASSKPLAIITGGAVRLGQVIALSLANAGYTIGLHYHTSEAAAHQTARQLSAQDALAFLHSADLRDPAQVDALFARSAETGLPLRVLINSASVMPRADILQMLVSEWDDTLALNLRAPWLCARCAAKQMDAAGGVIVNLTDAGAGRVWTNYPAYIISKSGLDTLTRLLARALAPRIRVNAVAPGLILPSADMSSSEWDRLVDRTPLKKAGDPQAIADAVHFLINNSHITGQTLVVDGGYQLI